MNRLTILNVLRATAESAGHPIGVEPLPELEAVMEEWVVAAVSHLEELQSLNPELSTMELEEATTAWLVGEWERAIQGMVLKKE